MIIGKISISIIKQEQSYMRKIIAATFAEGIEGHVQKNLVSESELKQQKVIWKT